MEPQVELRDNWTSEVDIGRSDGDDRGQRASKRGAASFPAQKPPTFTAASNLLAMAFNPIALTDCPSFTATCLGVLLLEPLDSFFNVLET